MRRWVFVARRVGLDWSFHPTVACVSALAFYVTAALAKPFAPAFSFRFLCRSHHALMRSGLNRFFSARLTRIVERSIRAVPGAAIETIVLNEHGSRLTSRGAQLAGIVLKTPRTAGGRVVERGVLLLKNNERIGAVTRAADLPAILERYLLVLEPSWSGYADPRLLAFTAFPTHPIVVMATCREDYEFVDRLGSNLRPIALGASDWVDPRAFHPLEGTGKEFDAVMVARWTITKRHHVLLRVLRQIGDPMYRVALAAGYTHRPSDQPAILESIARSGVARQITIFENLAPRELNEVLNRSKVNLLLSRQEGSNRSVFEGFFAGIPALAFRDNLGIAKSHFTPETGRLIDERDLAPALVEFREGWRRFNPRPWALAHIAPEVSTRALNARLRALAAERHEPWTQDIVAKCNGPELEYYPEAGVAGFATLEELVARHPRAG